MQAGSSVTLGFEIGNGARHVGPCTAQLVDLSTGRTQDIGSEADCVNKRDAMTVKLPSQTCTNCVIKVKVTATHLGASNPEFYDSCMDVNISGGSGGGNGGGNGGGGSNPAPAPPTAPTPTQQPPANPGRQARPTPTNAAPQRPGRDQLDGSNGDANGPCQVGQMKCGPGGNSILMCDPSNKFVSIPTAGGTKCVPNGNSVAINSA
ncbi:hypothetical protein BCR44DRAFT_1442149 [Catenaria anguillulae PL171]|uniref:Uncharacterized protein n=1 Tax=Catenaria anguillulae PL171 TaxID=765915 RepID=A0A1Y2HEI2_9FUNG|nr:hypothetical protein BCR44DRAFT_1442149 [Catenaria anguillulae PL171]